MASRRSPTRGPTHDPPPPPGLRTAPLSAGDHSLVVFSFPIPAADERGERTRGRTRAPASAELDVLTPSEREVVRAILSGHTNAEIAALRGRSVHTINRQVEAAYRKLGVGSRGELCARFAGGLKGARQPGR